MGTGSPATVLAAGGHDPAEVDELIALIGSVRLDGALNLYDELDSVAWGDPPGQATERRLALHAYLAHHWNAPIVLVGEAPGQHGARWSGVPFTSLRQLTGRGPVETSATIVRRALADLGAEHRVLLWNASFLFPPGNRVPRRAEVEACAGILDRICRGRAVIAVGRQAEKATGATYLRHPSHGGARLFAAGLQAALQTALPTAAGQ